VHSRVNERSGEKKMSMIDARAIVDPSAVIAKNVTIGPYSVIGPDVEIGEGTVIESHVVIKGPTKIGRDNHFFQYSSIGEMPQDLKYKGEATRLEIGDRNSIREFCTLNRGTVQGGGLTKMGDDNLLMAYVHLAHDCLLGNHIVMANNASLAGHVTIHDHAVLGGFCAIHQFCHVGAYSIAAGGSMVSQDVAPFIMVSGHFAKPYGLNKVGLRRKGFTEQDMLALKQAYRIIYRKGLKAEEALVQLAPMVEACHWINDLMDAIKRSERGLAR
jgi:UDP-N-acetylglucosamine acyltransferase